VGDKVTLYVRDQKDQVSDFAGIRKEPDKDLVYARELPGMDRKSRG